MKLELIQSGYCTHPEFVAVKGGSFKSVAFPATVAVIEHPQHGIILFDTGYSDHNYEATKTFPEKFYAWVTPIYLESEETLKNQLKSRGISAKDVKTIVVSHFHADHIGGLKDFPDAHFIYHDEAYNSLKDLGRFAAVRRGFLPYLLPDDFLERSTPVGQYKKASNFGLGPFVSGWDLFGDGRMIAIDLPGHEVGHIGLAVFPDDKSPHFFVSDACYSEQAFTEGRLPHSIAKLIIQDFTKYKDTISELSTLHSQMPEVQIIPCHCGSTHQKLPESF